MTEEQAPGTTSAGPLRNPGFRWFFAGRLVSLAGSAMAPVALAFAVLDATHSAGSLGVVLAARSVPMLLFLLIGGVVGDRFPRRTVLLVANLGAAATQGTAAALFLTGGFHLAAIAALEFANGVLTAFTTPALRGIVPQLVEPDQRQRANSLLGSSKNLSSIVGPSLAGTLVLTAGSGWAIAIDALTYLLAAACLARLTLPGAVEVGRAGFLHELREGWTAFRALTWVCLTVLAFAATNAIYVGVWNVLGPTIADTTIGAAAWGLILSARAIGTLVATTALYRLRARSLPTGLLCFATGALPLIALALSAPVWLLVATSLIAGIGHGTMAITWETLLQQKVPNTLLSRISAYDDLVSFAAVPVGQLAVAPLAAATGQTEAMLLGGILFALIVTLPLLSPSVRHPSSTP
ncbi:MFS transporter [Actinokineospora bangkokensis]|uniref:MFS transporter n=1 Tax=Actinokineospora bangkokensis TaxID=1193682 RepID=A0A1Q9LNV1_9PSEU|nr:MFS transporter [Actinokineospora bangkokensis]OLR93700.1 MFS transporter [Actinokineospora bangkokensis]